VKSKKQISDFLEEEEERKPARHQTKYRAPSREC
jgi:hypothetical protein